MLFNNPMHPWKLNLLHKLTTIILRFELPYLFFPIKKKQKTTFQDLRNWIKERTDLLHITVKFIFSPLFQSININI